MPSGYTNSPYEKTAAATTPSWGQQSGGERYGGQQLRPAEAAMDFLHDYARERPEVVAMWAFGIGFVLAWKLKPW
ncbi:MAG: hypothetical protein H0T51_21460 [Pirellulales bacterium]|nr:hypothetical protein [Pirellulales bacterium]